MAKNKTKVKYDIKYDLDEEKQTLTTIETISPVQSRKGETIEGSSMTNTITYPISHMHTVIDELESQKQSTEGQMQSLKLTIEDQQKDSVGVDAEFRKKFERCKNSENLGHNRMAMKNHEGQLEKFNNTITDLKSALKIDEVPTEEIKIETEEVAEDEPRGNEEEIKG